jgi:hypothetical protein
MQVRRQLYLLGIITCLEEIKSKATAGESKRVKVKQQQEKANACWVIKHVYE